MRTHRSRRILAATLATALLAGTGSAVRAEDGPGSPPPAEIPAGTYRLDPSHASLVFQVDHAGFSSYTGSFAAFDATLEIDPKNPAAGKLVAVVDVGSLAIPRPPEGFLATLLGPGWFDSAAFPEIAFRSTSIEVTGPDRARVTGDLSLLARSLPVTFEAVFNGGYAGFPPYDPQARIGFSAEGSLKRSDFGMTVALPPEGTTMGVGDEVRFRIEAEFSGPPLAAPAAE